MRGDDRGRRRCGATSRPSSGFRSIIRSAHWDEFVGRIEGRLTRASSRSNCDDSSAKRAPLVQVLYTRAERAADHGSVRRRSKPASSRMAFNRA